jgi:hypothetical protein
MEQCLRRTWAEETDQDEVLGKFAVFEETTVAIYGGFKDPLSIS